MILTLASCATPQELERYSTRNIDRPYTLPEGLNSWKTQFTAYFDSTNHETSRGLGGLFPFNWEQGLTDNLTLIWSPLPFQLRYQFYRDSTSFMGIYFNFLGPTYARGYDFNWSPTLHGTYRKTLSTFWAVQGTLLIEPEINRNNPFGNRTLGLELGFWAQPFETWSLGIKQDVLWETGDPRSRYFGQVPPLRSDQSRFLFPLYLEIQGMLSHRLQVELEYRYLAIPDSNQFMSHQFLGGMSYFW